MQQRVEGGLLGLGVRVSGFGLRGIGFRVLGK